MGVVKEESEERRAAGGRKRRRRRRGKEKKDEEAIYVAMASTHSLSFSLSPSLVVSRLDAGSYLDGCPPACLLACPLARSFARLLGPASLDYLKNRIPPARNCVSRLPCLYTNTRVGEQCWMRCTCTAGPRLTGPAFPPA